ncbi:MAG: polysaccharide deacetylase family protein [Candidatus Schekmanbacteria bacterium]|nr:polysaccharide deacetylase family protein [Candidatus Schekmanbacteria bacterium]
MGHLQEAFQDIKGSTFRILLYHSVSDKSNYPYAISVDEFSWQMEYLHKHKVTVDSLENVLSKRQYHNDIHGRRVVISFDDGYEDNFTAAVPVMDKYGYKATIFISTAFIGDSNRWEDPAFPRLKMMNRDQIMELAKRGHTIGGHTHGHINMAAQDLTKVKEDLAAARRFLFQDIKSKFIPFAYPFGKYNQNIIDLIQQEGYSCAVTAGGFWGNNPHISKWELRREDIHRNTRRRDFMAQVRGARDPHYWRLGVKYLK